MAKFGRGVFGNDTADVAKMIMNKTEVRNILKVIEYIKNNQNWREILAEAPYHIAIKDDGDFMTNSRTHLHDIYKCGQCNDGYMIVMMSKDEAFYGCTNYDAKTKQGCKNTKKIFTQKH
jgi:hypothetical protein